MSKESKSSAEKPIAIQVWTKMKSALARETSPELSVDKFVIQKDAFMRIADDDVAADVPFLSYEYSSMTTDESLDFSVYFFKEFIHLNIGPTYFELPYVLLSFNSTEILGKELEDLKNYSVSTIASNIVMTVKMLLNGQFAVGLSWKNGNLLAAETFIIGYEATPLPIALTSLFTTFNRKAYEYTVKQNHVLTDRITVTDEYPLLPPIINKKRVRRGRTVDSVHDLEPMTKALFRELEDRYQLHENMGADPANGSTVNIYKSVVFWLTAVVYIALVLFLAFSPVTPDIFHGDFVLPIMAIVGNVLISFTTGIILAMRQTKINKGERPITFRIEEFISQKISGK